MSKSLYYTKSRTINNVVREHDNIVTFLSPIGKGEDPFKYKTGETVKTTMLPYGTAIHQNTSVDISNTSFVTVAYYDYTPVISSSQIIVEYFTTYTVSGNSAATDAYTSALYIDNTPIGKGIQQWLAVGSPISVGGTGTRSGTIFPLLGAYTNNSITSKTISIVLKRSVGDDTVRVNADEGTWLKITEIAL